LRARLRGRTRDPLLRGVVPLPMVDATSLAADSAGSVFGNVKGLSDVAEQRGCWGGIWCWSGEATPSSGPAMSERPRWAKPRPLAMGFVRGSIAWSSSRGTSAKGETGGRVPVRSGGRRILAWWVAAAGKRALAVH